MYFHFLNLDSETYDIIKELFKSLLQKFQEGLEESMKGNEFIIDSVNLLQYKLNKMKLGRGGCSLQNG